MKILKDKKKKKLGLIIAGVAVVSVGLVSVNISNDMKRARNEKIIEEDKKLLDDIKQNKIRKPIYNNEDEHDDGDEGHNHE